MNFKDFLILSEASYVGNIGMMEMFKFFQRATPGEKARMKALLSSGNQDDAWKFLQKITGVKLQEQRSELIAKRIPDGYREGKMTWAAVKTGSYGDEVVESGFSSKKSVLEWIAKNS